MTDYFAMSANVHHPVLKSVYRLSADHEGRRLLSIQLGQPDGYSHVSLLVTDEQWRAIVLDAYAGIAEADGKVAAAADEPSFGGEKFSTDPDLESCPACHFTAEGNVLTEHVFAEHPDVVAR